jgi:hypothetical protein
MAQGPQRVCDACLGVLTHTVDAQVSVVTVETFEQTEESITFDNFASSVVINKKHDKALDPLVAAAPM